ncbi:MAG: hypothetical protein ACRD4K_10020 [Candidatus Acidiferrales bacterium]
MRLLRNSAYLFLVVLSAWFARAAVPRTAANNSTSSPAIVIGLVGGYVSHENLVHAEVSLAADLAKAYPTGVYVAAFENHRGKQAYKQILKLLDANHDGILSDAEKQQARIILYGHSWGASEAVALARKLGRDGIPVLLTIQVDSVAKHGENDAVIPANVAEAVNFFQTDGYLKGRSEIRAEDPTRTRIIGNFQSHYKSSPLACKKYPWWDHIFAKAHTQIECDPAVWNKVEALIRAQLPPASPTASAQ